MDNVSNSTSYYSTFTLKTALIKLNFSIVSEGKFQVCPKCFLRHCPFPSDAHQNRDSNGTTSGTAVVADETGSHKSSPETLKPAKQLRDPNTIRVKKESNDRALESTKPPEGKQSKRSKGRRSKTISNKTSPATSGERQQSTDLKKSEKSTDLKKSEKSTNLKKSEKSTNLKKSEKSTDLRRQSEKSIELKSKSEKSTDLKKMSRKSNHLKRKYEKPTYLKRKSQKSTDLKKSEKSSDLKSQKSFICDVCQKCFVYKRGLERHKQRMHVPSAPQPCDQCFKVFRNKEKLRSHENYHKLVMKTIVCEGCNRYYATKLQLKRHVANCWDFKLRTPI